MEKLTINNLSQSRQEAKQLYLKHQHEKVLKQLETAEREERITVICHIDGFLSSTTPGGKIFCLKIREKLERLNERFKEEN